MSRTGSAADGARSRLRVRNPVLDRELRQRARSLRSTVMVFAFLVFLTGVLWASHRVVSSDSGFDPFQSLTVDAGQTVFEWVLTVELTILLFFVPAISAGAVSGERDRQTLMPLQVTLMKPSGIFMGKAMASSGFVLLLVTASVPVLTVPYLLGGITLGDVVRSLSCLLAIGLVLALIGVGCSAVFRRTQTATLAAYGTMLGLTAGSGMLAALTKAIDEGRGFDESTPVLATMYPNPFVALASASGDLDAYNDTGPLGAVRNQLREFANGEPAFFGDEFLLDADAGGLQTEATVSGVAGLPLWICSLGSLALLASLFALWGIRALRAPDAELRS